MVTQGCECQAPTKPNIPGPMAVLALGTRHPIPNNLLV